MVESVATCVSFFLLVTTWVKAQNPFHPGRSTSPRGRHLFIFVNQGPPSFDPYRGKTDQTGVDGLQPNSDGLQPKRDELSM